MRIPGETDFWNELDEDVLRCLAERHGQMTPTELGARLGMSESAVCSVIAMLAETGRVRITSVEGVV